MAILVTGGAGYIGAHVVQALTEQQLETAVLDTADQGRRAPARAQFFQGTVCSKEDVRQALRKLPVETIVHCAGPSRVEESMQVPERYYEAHISGTLNLLGAMLEAGVKNIVYTSSAAVYGEPERIPMHEDHRLDPVSVYGHVKLCVEKMLEWFGAIHGIRSVALRCCNAAGAHPSGSAEELQMSDAGLIPLAIQAALSGRPLPVRGTGYATRDGSCVRDYVHVCDVADAHLKACRWLAGGKPSAVFNIGRGTGASVREVAEAVEKISGRKIELVPEPNRPGDPSIVIAGIAAARQSLGWQPAYKELQDIITTSYERQSRRQDS